MKKQKVTVAIEQETIDKLNEWSKKEKRTRSGMVDYLVQNRPEADT